MRITIPACRTTLAAVLLLAGGCGTDLARLEPVHGTVYYKDKPLPGGTIVFVPDTLRGNRGPLAQGQIQPDGSYVLQTGDTPGAVAGWHRVTVAAVEPPDTPPAGQRFAAPRSLLPAHYRDPERSGLTGEVRADQENRIDFRLE